MVTQAIEHAFKSSDISVSIIQFDHDYIKMQRQELRFILYCAHLVQTSTYKVKEAIQFN